MDGGLGDGPGRSGTDRAKRKDRVIGTNERVRHSDDEIAIEQPHQSLSGGAAGIALLHIERARTGASSWEKTNTWLEVSVRDGVSVSSNACLYFGAPALAFVLHGAADQPGIGQALATVDVGTRAVVRNRLDAAHRRIDAGDRPALGEFDLISGLTGLGACLRRRGCLDLLRDVLAYLVQLSEPLHGLPGWWTFSSTGRTASDSPGGHGNNGMAHGITGPLALLSMTLRDGIMVDGQAEAISRICAWLDHWEGPHEAGAWWPETVTLNDLQRGRTSQAGPLRPSWCYGTPGIARAQQLAALATGDLARQQNAEAAFVGCVNDPAQLGRIIDRSLCHGTAGLLMTARRIADDALNEIPVPMLSELHRNTAALTDEPSGFLIGTAGAELARHTAATGWDACLLLI